MVGKIEKSKGGRPTKLDVVFCEKLKHLVADWDPLKKRRGRDKFADYLRLCTKDSVALAMGINRETLREYCSRDNSGFSGTVKEIIDHWETKRNALHMCILPYFERKEAVWIFLSKNFNQFTDEVRIGNIPGEALLIEARRRVAESDPETVIECIRRAQLKIAGEEH